MVLTGPVRPTPAMPAAQPMIETGTAACVFHLLTLIENSRRTATGTGRSTRRYLYAIYSNWGLSRVEAGRFDYSTGSFIEQEIQASGIYGDNTCTGQSTTLPMPTGLVAWILFDPRGWLMFGFPQPVVGWAPGRDMMELAPCFHPRKVRVSWCVPTISLPQPGSAGGRSAPVVPRGDCGECTVRNIQFLQPDR